MHVNEKACSIRIIAVMSVVVAATAILAAVVVVRIDCWYWQ